MEQVKKMSVEEIRDRYDHEVERFANLSTGQATTVDAPVNLELIARAAASSTPAAKKVLDIGCGAGNATLSLLRFINPLNCDLLDLSMPMLNRAHERVAEATTGSVRIFQSDIREANLEKDSYDIILAATVLHHLRTDKDWKETFTAIYDLLAPGGGFWITDLICHELDSIQDIMWKKYGDYLVATSGEQARDKCFEEIEREDTPRPLTYQLDLLKKVGFRKVDVLHKNSCFAAFGAVK
jgi:tRNA (cmo5U34)-methyltransferase